MGERKKILTVTIHDCEVQTFRAGGKGGQNQNKRDTGVRVIHHPSGARGESREERSQLQNKQAAFKRMAEHVKFKTWVWQQTSSIAEAPSYTGEIPENDLKVEFRIDGKWIEQ